MSVLILRDADGRPCAVAETRDGAVVARGIKGVGREWADWVNANHAGSTLIEIKAKSARTARLDGPTSDVAVDTTSSEVDLRVERQNRIEFKTSMALRNADLSSAVYEMKRSGRAVWDPDLAGGRGGFRCPPGTRYAGRWTDKFASDCGWGVSRRLANAVENVGASAGRLADDRRDRRVERRDGRRLRGIAREERRVARAQGRLDEMNNGASPREARRIQRLEAGAARRERVADRIERFEQRRQSGRADRLERGAARRERIAERIEAFDNRRGANRDERRARRLERGANRRDWVADRIERFEQRRNDRTNRRTERRANRQERAAARRERLAARIERVDERRQRRAEGRPERRAARQERAAARRERLADRLDPEGRPEPPQPERTPGRPEAERRPRPTPARNPRRRRVEDAPAPAETDTPGTPDAEKPDKPTPAPKPKRVTPAPRPTRPARRRGPIINKANLSTEERATLGNEVSAELERLNDFWNARIPGDVTQAKIDAYIAEREGRNAAYLNTLKANSRDRFALQAARDDLDKLNDVSPNRRKRIIDAAEGRRRPERSPKPKRVTPKPTPKIDGSSTEVPEPEPLSEWARAEAENYAAIAADPFRADLIDAIATANPVTVDEFINRIDEAISKRDSVDSDAEWTRVYNEAYMGELRRIRSDAVRGRSELERLAAERAARRKPEPKPDPAAEAAAFDTAKAERLEAEAADGLVDPFADSAELFAARIDEKRKSRVKILADYMKSRYGDDEAPWLDPATNPSYSDLASLSRSDLDAWAKRVFQHNEIKGLDGATFRTEVTAVRGAGTNTVGVDGKIMALNPATGQYEMVGTFSRSLNLANGTVYNNSMKIGPEAGFTSAFAKSMKDKGFTSVFNPHAFTWYRGAGFKEVGVSAAWDGTYVWGRVGFRPRDTYEYRSLHNAMEREVAKYRRGERSVIGRPEDAAIIDMLLEKGRDVNWDPATTPGHLDFIMALSNRGRTKDSRDRREAQIKRWFQNNAPFSSGRLDLTNDSVVPLDPRQPDVTDRAALPGPRPRGLTGTVVDGTVMPSFADLATMTKTTGPLGSNGGDWYIDPASGRTFLVKPARSAAHAENEAAMAAVYRALGVSVPNVSRVDDGNGDHFVVSEKVQITDVTGARLTEAQQANARAGMGADLLLSNWDVFGASGDNVGIDADGNVVRIDLGGAGLFRARGGVRDAFDPTTPWSDVATMLDRYQGRALYGKVTNDDFVRAMDGVANMDIGSVRSAMENAGASPEYIDRVADVLTARRTEARRYRTDFASSLRGVSDENEWGRQEVAIVGSQVRPGVPVTITPPTPRSANDADRIAEIAAKGYPAAAVSVHFDADRINAAIKGSDADRRRLVADYLDELVAEGIDRAEADLIANAFRSRLDGAVRRLSYDSGRSEVERERIRDRFRMLATTGLVASSTTVTGFLGIVRDGRFKSQFETGTSMGALDPERRRSVERGLVGMPGDISADKRVIYGHVRRADGSAVGYPDHYGAITVIMKPEVRSRTFITGGDSFSSVMASPIDGPHHDGSIVFGGYTGDGVEAYMETQILGGVTLDDVAEVRLQAPLASLAGRRELTTAIRTLHARGINVYTSTGGLAIDEVGLS